MDEYENSTTLESGSVNAIVRHPDQDGAVPGFDGPHIELECNADAGSVHLVGTPGAIADLIASLTGALATI